MFQSEKIESLDLPELEPYRTLRRPEDHERRGIFVATNAKVVTRLLATDCMILSMLMTEEWLAQLRPLIEARRENIRVYLGPKKLLETITGYTMHQGVLALAQIPPRPSLDEILRRAARPVLLAAVDGFSSAENLGALIRSCGAFGAHALLVSETSCSPFLRRCVSSSMGVIFHVPTVECVSLVETLNALRSQGIRVLAAHPEPRGRTIVSADFSHDCCVVFGSEGYGISGKVLAVCDEKIAIPMLIEMDSLNAASAGAVFLYEAARQRGALSRSQPG
jgi:tRNA G18 (ribose-2'-O)-methylase SpoU